MLVDAVRQMVERHRMVEPGDIVVVAVSGGPDSVALAHVLWTLAPELGVQLHIFHLDHGLRPGAAEDARWVAAFAARLGVPCTVRRVPVADLARQYGGVEAAGRAVRYQEMGQLAADLGARCIAVGHTQDDQAETLLMRLLRGAGRRGLAGMAPVRPAGPPAPAGTRVIRPLLACSRAQVEAYCQAHALDPRRDPTNAEPLFLRNRIRLELLPLLRERYQPAVVQRLAGLAAVLRDEEEYLDATARAALARHGGRLGPEGAHLPATCWQEPPAIARRMVWLAGEATGVGLELRHVEAVLDLARRPGTAALDLPGGWRAVSEYGHVRLERRREPLEPPPAVALSVPGAVELPWAGLRVEAAAAPPVPAPAAGPWRVDLAPDGLALPLAVRTWRPGDRIHLVGMAGSKKLQDLFVDLKIPRDQRHRIPVVVDGRDQVLWVVGVRADRRHLARPGGPRLALAAEPMAEQGSRPWA